MAALQSIKEVYFIPGYRKVMTAANQVSQDQVDLNL